MSKPDKAESSEEKDSPSRDEHHDESRTNQFDIEVAEDLGADEEE